MEPIDYKKEKAYFERQRIREQKKDIIMHCIVFLMLILIFGNFFAPSSIGHIMFVVGLTLLAIMGMAASSR